VRTAVIGPQKMKLAEKKKTKKEKRTSRVSWHDEHGEMARAPARGTATWHVR